MPIKTALVIRFFQLVNNRQFTEAERELQRLKQKIQKTEWNRGYYRALYGILLAKKANNDPYVFLSNLDVNDKNFLQHLRKEFLKHMQNRLHGEYDRGFFSAWSDYLRLLLKMETITPEKQVEEKRETQTENRERKGKVEPETKYTQTSIEFFTRSN
jgi:hypothetical protein